MRAGWLRIAAVAGLLAISCGPTHDLGRATTSPSDSGSPGRDRTPMATATPSFTGPPTPASSARTDNCSAVQPAPLFPPSGASTRKLALVSLSGSTDFVVRDITDINHPFTVSSLGGQVNYGAKFVNDAELSTADGSVGLLRMPLSGSPKTVVAACGALAFPFAWSPDGTAVAYARSTPDPQIQKLHLVSGGQDRVVDSMPAIPEIGCEQRSCGDSWDFRLLYSPNGAYISLVELPGAGLRIWTSSGSVVKSIDGNSPTMSVWSGNTLYWRDDKGVEMWRGGSQSLLLAGVSWIRPKASPDGGQVVYETRDTGYTTPRIFLLDTGTGKTRQIAQSRSEPAFLTSRYLWYMGERPCKASDSCPFGPTIATIPYIYDLQTGTEYQSIISTVWDVWPHAG